MNQYLKPNVNKPQKTIKHSANPLLQLCSN